DGHNDLAWEIREKAGSSFDRMDIARLQPDLHTDIPRLRRGGVGAQFWSAYAPASTARDGSATRVFLEQIDLIHRMIDRYPQTFEQARTADDILRIHRQGRIACLIGVEGGYAVGDSLGVLRDFFRLGVRYMTLTHADTTGWADSATDLPRHGGLTEFGEQVVRTMNDLGMLVDISHVSVETMRDVLRVSRAPVIASHSSAFALLAHPRNVPDEILRGVAANGGVVMVNFFSGFLVPPEDPGAVLTTARIRKLRRENPDPDAFQAAMTRWYREHPLRRGSIADVVDHIAHIARVAGVEHVGLGSDFDGVSLLPRQLEDVSTYPLLTQALLDRGFGREEILKILGGNVLRVLCAAEEAARRPAPAEDG
ncbi:MAG: dipeptidase, partial [Planctomycetota bacterium]